MYVPGYAEEKEMYEHYAFEVDKGQTPLRIDKFLTSKIEGVSRNKIQNASTAECILVNKNPVKSSYKVKPGDSISVVMPHPPRVVELIPENIPVDIVYEDDDLIIVNKEAGMVVHPGYANYTGTLVNALMYHFKDLPQKEEEDIRPGLVHRIDKDTTGLLVVAKTEIAQTKLAKYFFDKTIDRAYVALVWGDMEKDKGAIAGNIGRSIKDRRIMQVYPDGKEGKPAITHYKVLERFRYVTLVECRLETGRTHQIRAHFKYINHPLFGDATYGGDKIMKGTTFSKYKQFVNNCFKILPRQALHAKSLGFIHPVSGEQVFFDSTLPKDMEDVIGKWRRYVVSNRTDQ